MAPRIIVPLDPAVARHGAISARNEIVAGSRPGWLTIRDDRGNETSFSAHKLPLVAPHRWSRIHDASSGTFYWHARLPTGETIRLHVQLAQPPPGMDVHHRNGDGSDNTDENLEVLPIAEHRNQRRAPRGTFSRPTGKRGITRQTFIRADGTREEILRATATGPGGQHRKRFALDQEEEAEAWQTDVRDGVVSTARRGPRGHSSDPLAVAS